MGLTGATGATGATGSTGTNGTTTLFLMGNSGTDEINTAATTEYVGIADINSTFTGTQASRQTPVPASGTAANLSIVISQSIGTGSDAVTFTVMIGGTATGITCTINVGGTGTGQTSSTACSSSATAAFTAGSLISLRVVTTNSPASSTEAMWGLQYTIP
jgi:hypothetical protein